MRYYTAIIAMLGLSACSNDADVVSQNLSTAADNFQINRRIVFYNGITDKYILQIEGLCSIGAGSTIPKEITVTCQVGPGEYKKHFLGVSDNVTFFAEQIEASPTNKYLYKVTFKPESIIPNIQLR